MRISFSLGCLLLALVGALAPAAAEELTVFAGAASGFKKDGEAFVPLGSAVDCTGPAPVLIEAEQPDEAVWARGGKVFPGGPDGSSYVAGFQALRYYCASPKASTVAVWARLRSSGADQTLYINDVAWNVPPEVKKEAGKWQWVRLAEVALPAGVRPLQVIAAWPGHNHPPLDPWPHHVALDALALCFDGGSLEATPPRPARTTPTPVFIESDGFLLPRGSRLVSAAVSGSAPGGVLEASADGGATWLPANGLPLAGAARLCLRFPNGAGSETRVRDFRVTAQVDPARYLVLKNGRARVCINVESAGVSQLDALGTAFAAPGLPLPLFSLSLKQSGRPWPDPPLVLEPDDGKILDARLVPGGVLWRAPVRPAGGGKAAAATTPGASPGAGAPRESKSKSKSTTGSTSAAFEPGFEPKAVLRYAFLDGTLVARVTITLHDGGDSTWELSLDNRSEWDVLTFTFPRIAGLKVGGSGYDDRWLNTNVYGPWIAGYNCFGAFRPEERPYPGWGALGFTDLFDDHAGLSFASREPEVGLTRYALRPAADRWSETVNLEVVKEHCVTWGEPRTWSYSLLPHTGDWHAAADAYGAWFRRRFGTADHWPEWVRDNNGWVQANPALLDSFYKWPMLLDTFEEGRRLGIRHVQVWGQFGSSSCASFWWPSPKYGPIKEFAAVNKRIRDQGGHVGYYLIYNMENRYNILDTETYEGYLPRTAYPKGVPVLGKDALIRGAMVADPEGRNDAWPRTGQQMVEFRENLSRLHAAKMPTTWAESKSWPAHSMVSMNPRDHDWRQWLVHWTVGLYARQWHCDTAYQDVLGVGNAGRSFDLRRVDHGHVRNAESDLARLLVEEGKKADPQFALSAEGKSELVTRWAMGMTSSQHYGWTDLAAHRYTHPDHVLFFGGSNGGHQRMAEQCDLAFLYGARFDLVLTGDLERVRRTVAFREGFKRFTLRARYRDTVGVQVTAGQGIDATRHDRGDAGAHSVLITVLNREGTPDGMLRVDVSALPAGRFGAFWLADDGTITRPVLAPAGAGNVETPIPATRLSALLLVASVPPEEDLLAGVTPERTPAGCRYHLWVANLTPNRRVVPLALHAPAIGDRVLSLSIEPYSTLSRTVEGSFSPGQPHSGDVTLRAGGRTLAFAYLYPLVEDGSFERDGTPLPDAAAGARVARVGPGKGWQGRYRILNLAPEHRYRVTVRGRRMGPRGEAFGLVRVKDGAGQWHHTGLAFAKDAGAAWAPLTAEFDTPAELAAADVYLYNHNSEDAVEYDGLEVEMLR